MFGVDVTSVASRRSQRRLYGGRAYRQPLPVASMSLVADNIQRRATFAAAIGEFNRRIHGLTDRGAQFIGFRIQRNDGESLFQVISHVLVEWIGH